MEMRQAYFGNYCGQIHARLDQLIGQEGIADRQILLFGLNSSSYVVEDYLKSRGIPVAGYTDNNEKKRSESRRCVPAYAPQELPGRFGERAVILIMSKYYDQMKEQLETLGYTENRQIFRILDVNNLEQYIDFSDAAGMEELSCGQLKAIQLRLLAYLKRVCAEHGLRFYLTGGSLLGAVRHNGYIPWDDDIDVVMPMSDYRKLIRIVNASQDGYQVWNLYDHPQQFHGFYARLACPGTVIKTWDYPYRESLGINIDIFPLYGVPEEEKEADRFAEEMESLHVDFIQEFIRYPEPTERYYELQGRIAGMMDRYPFDDSTNIAYLLSRHKKKEIMPRSIYDRCVPHTFENESYPIPAGYDDYLRRLFGDRYMELPPKEERCSVHHYRAFAEKNVLQAED